MDLDLGKYVDKYFNVPIEELKKIRDENHPSDLWFEAKIESLHQRREWEKKYGRPALRTQPLVHVLSMSLQPKQKSEGKALAIYGHIYAEFHASNGLVVHDLYRRERDVAEVLGTSGNLTLNGPDYSCWPDYAYMPLLRSRVNVMLFDETDDIFARTSFDLDETDIGGDCEHVKSMLVHCGKGSLLVHYVVIPFGVHCRIEVKVCRRQGVEEPDFINLNGKVVARCANTYGDYSLEECVLFEKQGDEYERVEIDYTNRFHLSRCWVSLPAYSSLLVGVNLSEFETRRSIVNDTIRLSIEDGRMTTGSILLDDIAIKVHVAWFSPELLGRRTTDDDYHCLPSPLGIPTEEIEEMDTGGKDESSDDGSDDALSSSPKIPWSLHAHKVRPWPSPALEIFSVIFGRERSRAVQLYGSIEVLSGDCHSICYIFKRDEKDALVLSGNTESTAPIPDGSRVFDDCVSLQMKFDVKDVEGRLAIRGLVDWADSVLDTSLWHEKQLCSFIPGEQHGGFAAVHYSIFSDAVGANVKVFLNSKAGGRADVYPPKVWGSLIAQYSCYDYSSRYNKDYYRSVLFRRVPNDLIQVGDDATVPLSRSTVVVPVYSSLIVDVDLSFGVSDQKVSCAESFEIGEGFKTVETNDYVLRIELDWCEIK